MSYKDHWDISNNFRLKCEGCFHKDSLHSKIADLNSKITYLEARLTAARELQTLEKEFDTSVDELAKLFSASNLSEKTESNSLSEINISVANHETVTAEATINVTNDTTIWSDSETDNESENSDENSEMDKKYITMFLGDSTIKNIKLKNNDSVHERNVFKVARNNAEIDDLSETADFFIDKLGPEHEVDEIILHANTMNINQRRSELTKYKYKNFIQKFQQRGIKVAISGPIPNPQCSGETFSRVLEINDWLKNLHNNLNTFTFIDNFNTFWNKDCMFNKKHLNKIGETALLCNILQKLPID